MFGRVTVCVPTSYEVAVMLPICPLCLTNPIAWGLLLILAIVFALLWALAKMRIGWAQRALRYIRLKMKNIIQGFRKPCEETEWKNQD